MKKSLVAVVLIMLACSVGFAEAAEIQALPPVKIIDPIIIPPIHFLPCAFALLVFEMTSSDFDMVSEVSGSSYTSLGITDLAVNSVPVGSVLTHYQRRTVAAKEYVAMSDTFILLDGALRIYGRASNTVGGLSGARGILLDMVYNGESWKVSGTYSYTKVGGKDSICLFL